MLHGLIALALAATQQPIVITGVNVIPMDRPGVVANQTVVVENGRITYVGGPRSAAPAGATTVNGAGKYLIPGLAEMHAHVGAPANNPRILSLYALTGVTTARGMLGAPIHLALRDSLRRGLVFGPRFITSGPSINNNSAATVEAGVAAVQAQKVAGYDFLKIHPGVPRIVFDSIDAVADRVGIRFAGHVPLEIGIERALSAKYWTIDHLDGMIEALYNGSAPLTNAVNGLFGINIISQLDESRLPALVQRIKASGVAMVPTNILMENYLSDETGSAITSKPEFGYWLPTGGGSVEAWRTQKDGILANTTLTPAQRAQYIALRRRMLKALHDAGVMILLGSDAPQFWNVPGFSAHRELQAYVWAGLTPFQALQTGTVNVAEFLNEKGQSGVVRAGARADLLLLDANPLDDIANTMRISGVVVNGRWISAAERDRRLAELSTR